MANFVLDWNDGSGDKLTMNQNLGSGDAVLQVSSVPNNDLDRSRDVYVSAGSVTKKLTVNQTGLREVFEASDGEFTLADGSSFHTLKS